MKNKYYWLVGDLQDRFNPVLLLDAPEKQVSITLLSLMPRKKGELFKYLGATWKVTDCYEE